MERKQVEHGVEHYDLVRLRLWVDRLAADAKSSSSDRAGRLTKSQRKKLSHAQKSIHGKPSGQKESIRELISAGVVRYCRRLPEVPQGQIPDQISLEFATFALWPLVVASKLPGNWYEGIAEITSPSIAKLVAEYRFSRTTGVDPSAQRFAAALAQTPYAFGIVNLLDDLSDPRRGGAALTALALADDLSEPPTKGGRAVLIWILGAAGAGVIGNRVDAAGVDTWDWFENHIIGSHHLALSDSGLDSSSGGGGDGGHHRHSSGLVSFIEHLF